MNSLSSSDAQKIDTNSNPVHTNQNNPVLTENEEKVSTVAIERFLDTGLSIYKRSKSLCTEYPSVCCRLVGTGTLISATDNKVYIMTVSHLFSDEPEEYSLLSKDIWIPFRHNRNEREKVQDSITFIPVGEIGSDKQSIVLEFPLNRSENFHFHKD